MSLCNRVTQHFPLSTWPFRGLCPLHNTHCASANDRHSVLLLWWEWAWGLVTACRKQNWGREGLGNSSLCEVLASQTWVSESISRTHIKVSGILKLSSAKKASIMRVDSCTNLDWVGLKQDYLNLGGGSSGGMWEKLERTECGGSDQNIHPWAGEMI